MTSAIDHVRAVDSTAAGRLADHQLRSIALAGTVTVPSPFPSLGRIDVSTGGITRKEIQNLHDPTTFASVQFFQKVLLEVVHEVNPRLTITRVVKLPDVAAVFLPEDKRHVSLTRGQWYLNTRLNVVLLEELERCDAQTLPPVIPLLCDCIVYLPETAGVLLRVESGMTAAESVEYYPPTPGDRSFAFRNFRCDG